MTEAPERRVITTSQIQLFPPPYMIKRFMDVDAVVLLEEAQYTKRKFFDHFTIRDGHGLTKNIKIALEGGGGRQLLWDVRLVDWAKQRTDILHTLSIAYAGAPFFPLMMKWLDEECLPRHSGMLHGLCERTMLATMALLGHTKVPLRSTSLIDPRPVDPSDWLAVLTKLAKGTTYMQGRDAMDAYFDPAPFEAAGIELCCQTWVAPVHVPQFPTGELSVLHGLFHVGPKRMKQLLKDSGPAMSPWPVQEK